METAITSGTVELITCSLLPYNRRNNLSLLQNSGWMSGITSCNFALGKLTTRDYSHAASRYYKGIRTTPLAGESYLLATVRYVELNFLQYFPI